MTQAVNSPAQGQQLRQDWLARIQTLVNQIADWSQAEGWQVQHDRKAIREADLGEYEAPTLLVRLAGGELSVNPIALHAVGADGRVDLEAFPTLSRVKLVGIPGGWQVLTDSNVPLRAPWNRDSFVQLAHDLLS